MENKNKWITMPPYPPDGSNVEVMIDGKICNAVFHDYEEFRGWEIKNSEYDGFLLPDAWRFPTDTIAIVLKVDLENRTSNELGL